METQVAYAPRTVTSRAQSSFDCQQPIRCGQISGEIITQGNQIITEA